MRQMLDRRIEIQESSLIGILSNARRFPRARHVIHIHWSSILYGSRFLPEALFRAIVNFGYLSMAKCFWGIRICWTMHDRARHNSPHPSLDRFIWMLLWWVSDGIIVHQAVFAHTLQRQYPRKNIFHIPHGNYINAYGARRTDSDLRHSLGFTVDDVVLLTFGMVQPYKVIEHLIAAMQKACSEQPRKIKLLIVGRAEPSYAASLQRQIGQDPNIVFRNIFVPDEQIPDYFAAADYSLFWYDDSVLTSGAVILSLSYGVPVIMRDIPAAEIVSSENGLVYHTLDELVDILRLLSRTTKPAMENVVKSVASFDWLTTAGKTVAVYSAI